jgi:trans-aconitate methyltransferase
VDQNSKWDAALYDEKHSFVWKMAGALLELLDPKPGERILDVGCGTGHLTAQIAATGAQVTGVDRSSEMIAQARATHPALRFEVADARELQFSNEFEAVFSNATLHWITEPERAIVSIAKALRRGGRFVAEFGGKGNVAGVVAAVTAAWCKLELPESLPTPWYYPSVSEYAGLLEKHGLEVTYAALFNRPTPLEDGDNGLRNWLNMFGSSFTEKISSSLREKFTAEVEAQARPTLYHGTGWVMDYRRLRIVALRTSV